jgi:hypothetical protein
MKSNFLHRMRAFSKSLLRDNKGVAIIEFAYSLPILMAVGLTGSETALFVQNSQKISQIAMTVADNTSRLGEVGILSVKRVYEADIDDILAGAQRQMGREDFYDHAKIIISSVENSAAGNPYIHWQRCGGSKVHPSSFGIEGDGLTDSRYANGIGPVGKKVKPVPGSALILVEISYDYQSIFPLAPFAGQAITKTAVFNVRDTRDLTKIYDRTGHDVIAECA